MPHVVPVVPDSTPTLQELHIQVLTRLDAAPTSGIMPGTSGSPITVGTTQPVQGLSVGFQTPGSSTIPPIAPPRFTVPSVTASAAMTVPE